MADLDANSGSTAKPGAVAGDNAPVPSAQDGAVASSRPVPDAFGPPPYSCSPLDRKPPPVWGQAFPPGVAPQGPYWPVAYPYPSFMPYPVYVPPGPSKGFAITSLVCGVGGFPILGAFGCVAGILAVIFGAVALKKCREGTGGGRGMAIAGIITGAVTVLLSAAIIVFMILMVSSSMP